MNALSKNLSNGVGKVMPVLSQLLPMIKPLLPASAQSALTMVGYGKPNKNGGLSKRLM
jgi:hypothetical protein